MADKPSPIENLMRRRGDERALVTRHLPAAIRGIAVSNQILEAATRRLHDRMGSKAFFAAEINPLDLKAAIKAALMEYGK